MSDNPFDPPTPDAVQVTLKAGKGYEAPWLSVKGANVSEVLAKFQDSEDLANLIREAVGAGIAFQDEYAGRSGNRAPEPGSYGKPANADQPTDNTPQDNSLPYGGGSEQPMLGCEHGKRQMVTHGGKTGHVCPLPKGDPNRCETVFT
jgi:hypothetical protein